MNIDGDIQITWKIVDFYIFYFGVPLTLTLIVLKNLLNPVFIY